MSFLLIRISIYISPLFVFSFFDAGKGIIHPSLILILLAFAIRYIGNIRNRTGFKEIVDLKDPSLRMTFVFLFIAILSTITSFLTPEINAVSLYKSTGVLISLIILLGTYFFVSSFNKTPEQSKLLLHDFVTVSTIVAFSVIIEFIVFQILNVNVFYLIIDQIHSQLPYPSVPWKDVSIHDRYKGILNEPGDVGNFVVPAFSVQLNRLFSIKSLREKAKTLFLILTYVFATTLSASIICLLLMIFIAIVILIYRKTFISAMEFLRGMCIASFLIFFLATILFGFLAASRDLLHPQIISRLDDLVIFWNTKNYDNSSNMSVQVILNSFYATSIAFNKNPIFGTGLGNFSLSYDAAATANFIETRLNQHDGYSMFLRLLNEVGLLGLTSFAGIFLVRMSQGKNFLKYLKHRHLMSDHGINKISYRGYYLASTEQIILVNSAAMTCLINALLNYPTYWNVTLPMLFGICYRRSYKKTLSEQT